MLISNLMEHGIFIRENEICGAIIFKLELFSNIGIWVDNFIVDLQTACLYSEVLIEETFVILIDAEWGD